MVVVVVGCGGGGGGGVGVGGGCILSGCGLSSTSEVSSTTVSLNSTIS